MYQHTLLATFILSSLKLARNIACEVLKVRGQITHISLPPSDFGQWVSQRRWRVCDNWLSAPAAKKRDAPAARRLAAPVARRRDALDAKRREAPVARRWDALAARRRDAPVARKRNAPAARQVEDNLCFSDI